MKRRVIPDNIDIFMTKPRRYVGYANGSWKITRLSKTEWQAVKSDGSGRMLFAKSLMGMGEKLKRFVEQSGEQTG